MDSQVAKRPKVCRDTTSTTTTTKTDDITLASICKWTNEEAIAVKYYDVSGTCTDISYAEIGRIRYSVTMFLLVAKANEFIGIDAETPAHFLPGLMLGIMSSGRAFVCLPSSRQKAQYICNTLNVLYIFSPEKNTQLDTVDNFMCHGKRLYFLRAKNFPPDSMDSSGSNKLYGTFAYAVTTSGSTGEPKIVRVTHNSIVPNILDLKRILVLSKCDTIAQITPVTFDPSVVEIFLSLSCNGTLFMATEDLKNDPEMLLKAITQSRVTVLQSTPSLLLHRWSCEQLRQTILGKNSPLRVLLLGGERLPNPVVLTRIKEHRNKTKIFDIYGITEVSCWATIRKIDQQGSTPRILKDHVLSETILQVRDVDGKIIDRGQGILHIGSSSRICTIDNESIKDLKLPVFRDTGDIVEVDQKGCMILQGRRDRRVKRYGARLNLTILENHVLELPFVKYCYGLFIETTQSLHLYFTTYDKDCSHDDKSKYERDILNHTRKLPDIYKPDTVSLLSSFELTTNGKICQNFLKKLAMKTNVVPELCPANTFAKIWHTFLPASIMDKGFFDLGGTSIMALRIASELSDKVGRDFPELVGYLLRNEDFTACQSYISSRPSSLPNSIIPDYTEESLTRTGIEMSKESIEDKRRVITKVESIVPWQNCRGRKSFHSKTKIPKDNRIYDKFSQIRLLHLYDLGKCVDASPTVFGYPGGKSFVTVGSHAGVVCTAELSKEDSREFWKITLPDRIEASLLVLNDFRGVVGCYDGYVYNMDLKTGAIFWKFKTGDAVKCTAVISSCEKNVFFGSYDRYTYCVSLENGSQVWKVKAGNGSICATPCVCAAENCVLFALLDGTCVSLKQDNGKIIWQHKLRYPVFSAPVIFNNNLIVFCDVSGKLSCFSVPTGSTMWNIKINGEVFSHLQVYTDSITKLENLLFASKNSYIYKLECSTSPEVVPIFKMEKDTGVPMVATPCLLDEKIIVVVGTNGELKVLDFVTGESLNSFKLGGDVFSSPIIHDDFIVVGCRDNNLYVLSNTNSVPR